MNQSKEKKSKKLSNINSISQFRVANNKVKNTLVRNDFYQSTEISRYYSFLFTMPFRSFMKYEMNHQKQVAVILCLIIHLPLL